VVIVSIDVGVPEEDVVGKQVRVRCNRDLGMPEEEVAGKHDVAGCNQAYGGPEEEQVPKQDGAVRICIRMWPQEYQACEFVDENGGTPQCRN